jgi:hypothetical protein
MKDDYEALETLQTEGFAPALLRGIDSGLAIRATDRPQSIAEWRVMLEHASPGPNTTQVARRPARLPRMARRARRLRFKGVALWASLAASIGLLGGAGYLAWMNSATTVTTASLNLSAEQLEQALAERRKADAFALEKRQLAEEAQRRAEAEAEGNRRAEKELQDARLARQSAESELARLKADFAAREADRKAKSGGGEAENLAAQRAVEEATQRKAEEEAAALREAESQAQAKAAADAESNRLASEALARAQAEQQQAEAEAGRKAEAEAAKRKADEEALQKAEATAKQKGDAEAQKKVAEAAEKALRLEAADRERLQVALTSLGFDTRGRDGVLGPRSREMIAAWQKARKQPETGFLTAAQQQALLKEAAPAVGKFDGEKKADEEGVRAERERAREAAMMPVAAAAPPAPGSHDGTYTAEVRVGGGALLVFVRLTIANGRGSGTMTSGGCNPSPISVSISPAGEVSGKADFNCIVAGGNQLTGVLNVSGRHDGTLLVLNFGNSRGGVRGIRFARRGT